MSAADGLRGSCGMRSPRTACGLMRTSARDSPGFVGRTLPTSNRSMASSSASRSVRRWAIGSAHRSDGTRCGSKRGIGADGPEGENDCPNPSIGPPPVCNRDSGKGRDSQIPLIRIILSCLQDCEAEMPCGARVVRIEGRKPRIDASPDECEDEHRSEYD